jgi:hypothetical protein
LNATWVDKYKFPLLGLWSLLVVAYVHCKAPVQWRAEWTHDDLMNCYRILDTPWSVLLSDLVQFWRPTPLFRPLGELFYKAFWHFFGFDPLPWRLACGGLMIANAFILGHLATRLSSSLSVGLAATVLSSFHSLWLHLYLNSGTIFEILAFTFVYLGLVWYTEFHDPWGATLLLILGLNAKESAVLLPVYIVLYELLWRRRIPWLFCALSGAVCLAFIFGRVYGPGGLASIGNYQPTYSLAAYLNSFRAYFAPLILWKSAPLWACLLLAFSPLLLRHRLAAFSTAIFAFGILPLAFVPDRGLEGVYIACAALPLAIASILLKLPTEPNRLAGAAFFFLAAALWLPPIHTFDGWDREWVEIREFRQSLHEIYPQMPPRVQIRFESEPFTADYPWASTFITRLLYKDPALVVVSPNNPQTASRPASLDFTVLAWRGHRLYRVK